MNDTAQEPNAAPENLPVRMLTRDLILSALDLPTKVVDVPEWKGSVTVRAMTGKERDSFEASMIAEKGETRGAKFNNLRARLCAMVIVGADGRSSLFTEKDVMALGEKSARALNRVFDVARELSGFSEADVKELEGN